jgi:putative transposase
MARPWRIEYEGAIYHVISRGNERRAIFLDDRDRDVFLQTLGQMAFRFDLEVYAYVLMNNHYHLLIRTEKANLSKSMHWFLVTYTSRFNKRHTRNGHLFQGRFKSILVEDEHYLLKLSCYIHRNPLRAKIVRRLVDYPWSSYKVYAYGKSHPDWLRTSLIFSQFSQKDKYKAYREMVQSYSGEEKKTYEDFRHGLILGSRAFVDRIRSTFLTERPDIELPQQKKVSKDRDIREVTEKAADYLGCDIDDFKVSLRIGRDEKENRDLLIYLLWEKGLYKANEIGELFGLSYSSISKIAHHAHDKIKEDKRYRAKYTKLNSLFQI